MKKNYVSPRTVTFEVRCANIVAVSTFSDKLANPELPVFDNNSLKSETKPRNLWEEEW